MKIRILNLMLLALLIITSPVQGLAIDVIPNLISYLNANSGKKTPYEKLELISELLNKKQLVGEAHDQAIHELMIKHVYKKKEQYTCKAVKGL